jgi:hypothetical protein
MSEFKMSDLKIGEFELDQIRKSNLTLLASAQSTDHVLIFNSVVIGICEHLADLYAIKQQGLIANQINMLINCSVWLTMQPLKQETTIKSLAEAYSPIYCFFMDRYADFLEGYVPNESEDKTPLDLSLLEADPDQEFDLDYILDDCE